MARGPTSDKPRVRVRPPRPGEPEVLLDVAGVGERVYLVLVNVGPATAFDVSVTFARPLVGVGGEVVVSDLRVFRHLPLLRSGQAIRVFLDARAELARRRRPGQVRARVAYRSRTGPALGETFVHDLGIWTDGCETGDGA